MRPITTIVLHYSATPPDMDIGAEEIKKWHLERGFMDIGYHFVVRRDGTIERGRSIDLAGAHVKGHNADSVGICYVGGGTGQDTRTNSQRKSIWELVNGLRAVFGALPLRGHREMPGAATLCPGFDASKEYN